MKISIYSSTSVIFLIIPLFFIKVQAGPPADESNELLRVVMTEKTNLGLTARAPAARRGTEALLSERWWISNAFIYKTCSSRKSDPDAFSSMFSKRQNKPQSWWRSPRQPVLVSRIRNNSCLFLLPNWLMPRGESWITTTATTTYVIFCFYRCINS